MWDKKEREAEGRESFQQSGYFLLSLCLRANLPFADLCSNYCRIHIYLRLYLLRAGSRQKPFSTSRLGSTRHTMSHLCFVGKKLTGQKRHLSSGNPASKSIFSIYLAFKILNQYLAKTTPCKMLFLYHLIALSTEPFVYNLHSGHRLTFNWEPFGRLCAHCGCLLSAAASRPLFVFW